MFKRPGAPCMFAYDLPAPTPSEQAAIPQASDPFAPTYTPPAPAPEPQQAQEAQPNNFNAQIEVNEQAQAPSPPPPPPPPPPAPAPEPESSGGNDFVGQALAAHNNARGRHGANALSWSDELAGVAQGWANRCIFEHGGGKPGGFGENLAAGQSNIFAVIDAFMSEIPDYNPNSPSGSHFTQVVWKNTQRVGCAVTMCNMPNLNSRGQSPMYVCEYDPPGNIAMRGDGGQSYRDNVQL